MGAGEEFLFQHVADDIAFRLSTVLRDFNLALDIGANGGALARKLSGIDNIDRLIAIDDVPEDMKACGEERICADLEFLPVKTSTVDLVVSGLALQHANDLPGALAQIRKVLRPDGLFVGVLAGGSSLNELRTSLMNSEMEISGGVSPRIAPFADVRSLGGLLQRAGFALPVVDSDVLKVNYSDPLALMRDLRAMGWSNALMDRSRKPLRRDVLMRACQIYIDEFGLDNGRVPASFELITLTGWAPHESQQKPLRPGTAKRRLAEALGSTEISTGEKVDFSTDDEDN